MTETLPTISTSIDPKWTNALAIGGTAPLDVCRLIVEKSAYRGERIGNERALDEAKRMVGTYPFQAHDPENYLAGIASLFAEHPLRIVQKAIDRQTRKQTRTNMPTRADVAATIEEVLADRWKIIARAKRLIEEHEARVEEAQNEERRKRERQELRDHLGDAWDAWWSIPILRRYTGTAEDFGKRWKACGNDEDRQAFVAGWGIADQESAA